MLTSVKMAYQSNRNITAQLVEVSACLSRNGFPTILQFVDVTKPEPVRLDIDFESVASFQSVVDVLELPDPPASATRGRRAANLVNFIFYYVL